MSKTYLSHIEGQNQSARNSMYRKFTLQKKVTVLTPYLPFRSSTIPGRQQALANVQCASTLSVLSQRIQPVGHHSLEEQLIVLLELAIGGLPLGDGMECRLALCG